MISVHQLTKRFGKLPVLQGVDLELRPGRVTAVLGPNGAGKTTLIKSILGLTRPDSGVIRFGGEPIGDHPGYRARIGYMPQIARFPENLTAAELIAMVKDLRGNPADCDEELIQRFILDPHLDKPLRTLSGGTRQKVNAVIAFLFRPSLMMLDEPTAGLDPISSGVLKAKIAAEREDGRTFILTSHIMSELEELADDIVFLLDGRVRFAGAVRDLKVDMRELSLERAIAEMMQRVEAA